MTHSLASAAPDRPCVLPPHYLLTNLSAARPVWRHSVRGAEVKHSALCNHCIITYITQSFKHSYHLASDDTRTLFFLNQFIFFSRSESQANQRLGIKIKDGAKPAPVWDTGRINKELHYGKSPRQKPKDCV